MQIKLIFHNGKLDEFEKKLTDFITDKKIIDVKYQHVANFASVDNKIYHSFSALVMFE